MSQPLHADGSSAERPWYETMPPSPLLDSPVPYSLAETSCRDQSRSQQPAKRLTKSERSRRARAAKRIRTTLVSKLMRKSPFCAVCDVHMDPDGLIRHRPYLQADGNTPYIVCGRCMGDDTTLPPLDNVKREHMGIEAICEAFYRKETANNA